MYESLPTKLSNSSPISRQMDPAGLMPTDELCKKVFSGWSPLAKQASSGLVPPTPIPQVGFMSPWRTLTYATLQPYGAAHGNFQQHPYGFPNANYAPDNSFKPAASYSLVNTNNAPVNSFKPAASNSLVNSRESIPDASLKVTVLQTVLQNLFSVSQSSVFIIFHCVHYDIVEYFHGKAM